MPLGSIIGGIGTIAGSLFGRQGAKDEQRRQQRQANRQAAYQRRVQANELRRARRFDRRQHQRQRAAENRAWKRSRKAADQAYQRNKYLAETQIRRTVADAKAAGINPLVAIGASTTPQVAQAVTPSTSSGGVPYRAKDAITAPIIPGQPFTGSAIGDGIAQLGGLFDLESRGLQNDLLRAQIRATNASAIRSLSGPQSRSIIGDGANDIFGDRRFLRRSDHPDAEGYERRYDEWAALFGLRNLFTDTWKGFSEWEGNYDRNAYSSRIGKHFRQHGIADTLAAYINALQPRR